LDSGLETGARLVDIAGLIERNAEINVRFDPVWREMEDFAVAIDRLREHAGTLLAIEGDLENLFGRAPGELMRPRLRLRIGKTEGEGPLAADRIKRTIRAGRNDEHFAAEFDEAELLKGDLRVALLRREFLLHESDCAANASSGNAAIGEALDGAESDEVAEAIEVFSPAATGRNQAQALPIAQAARVQTKDAACFFPGKTLIQASGPRVAKKFCK